MLIGDETALPAICRRLEELPASGRALAVIEVDAGSDRPLLESRAAVDVVWVVRDGGSGAPAHGVIEALRLLEVVPRRCFL